VEEYHEAAAALDHRLTDPDPVRQWLRLGSAVLAVERQLSHLGFGPDPPPSTSCPADLDVAGFAEFMRQLRRGAAGWGQKVGGYWEECCRVWRVPAGTGPEPLTPEALEEAFRAFLEGAWAAPDLKDVSGVLARLRRYVSGWRAALRPPGGATPPAPPVPRIALTEEGVLLDGRPVPLDMTDEARKAARCFLKHLLAAAGDWRSSTELDDAERATGQAGGCCDHVGIRWDRFRKRLPAPLHNLTESNPRKGYRLVPAAWHR
jgi:hypothetical protein